MTTKYNRMKKELELMDWKNLEVGAKDQIRNGQTSIVIGSIMLKEIQKQIQKLEVKEKTNEKN